jgi:nucleolar protein 14
MNYVSYNRCCKMYDVLQRKDTLLQEYKIRKKSNMFVDKRIGEKDASLTAEDKMIARLCLF